MWIRKIFIPEILNPVNSETDMLCLENIFIKFQTTNFPVIWILNEFGNNTLVFFQNLYQMVG